MHFSIIFNLYIQYIRFFSSEPLGTYWEIKLAQLLLQVEWESQDNVWKGKWWPLSFINQKSQVGNDPRKKWQILWLQECAFKVNTYHFFLNFI